MPLESLIERLIARYCLAPSWPISLNSPLAEHGVDDIALAHVVLHLESTFGLSIRAEDTAAWATGEDIVHFVRLALAHRVTVRRPHLRGAVTRWGRRGHDG